MLCVDNDRRHDGSATPCVWTFHLLALPERMRRPACALPHVQATECSCREALVPYIREYAESRERRSEEHTSELQSLMRRSYAVFCLKKKKQRITPSTTL